AAEKILQELAVALGERHDDHFVGLLGAAQELLGVETRIRSRYMQERLLQERVSTGEVFHASFRIGCCDFFVTAHRGGFTFPAGEGHHLALGRGGALSCLLLRPKLALVTGFLVARSPPKYATQLENNDDRDDQEQEGNDVDSA